MFGAEKNKKGCPHCEVSEETLEALEGKKRMYECSECGAKYEEQEWAKKCENWCKEHETCNSEIIKHSI